LVGVQYLHRPGPSGCLEFLALPTHSGGHQGRFAFGRSGFWSSPPPHRLRRQPPAPKPPRPDQLVRLRQPWRDGSAQHPARQIRSGGSGLGPWTGETAHAGGARVQCCRFAVGVRRHTVGLGDTQPPRAEGHEPRRCQRGRCVREISRASTVIGAGHAWGRGSALARARSDPSVLIFGTSI
jgi:hypothetical protein